MNIGIFLLLMVICLGFIYLIHKYFGKSQFYLLAIIYSIISFLLSFKLINIFGMDINLNIIFNSGLIIILYYFLNRYNEKESRNLIFTILTSVLICICFVVLGSFVVPSVYDKLSVFYNKLFIDNIAIIILYPLSLGVTLFLSDYCFKELKKETNRRMIKNILTIFGVMFIDIAVFIYFSYAFIIKYDVAISIAISNYLVKVGIMIIYILVINKLFMVKKVK